MHLSYFAALFVLVLVIFGVVRFTEYRFYAAMQKGALAAGEDRYASSYLPLPPIRCRDDSCSVVPTATAT